MDELKKQGLYDNTLIVFFGDHGEEFLDHGSLLHGHTVYDEVTHVPLMIKLPHQKQGSVVTGTFPLIDVVPSVMRYLGLDPTTIQPHGNPNVDLANLKSAPDEYVFTAEVLEIRSPLGCAEY